MRFEFSVSLTDKEKTYFVQVFEQLMSLFFRVVHKMIRKPSFWQI